MLDWRSLPGFSVAHFKASATEQLVAFMKWWMHVGRSDTLKSMYERGFEAHSSSFQQSINNFCFGLHM